jgi:integrase/recombinase XerC
LPKRPGAWYDAAVRRGLVPHPGPAAGGPPAPRAPLLPSDISDPVTAARRLLEAFRAGLKPNTRRAYDQGLADFARSLRARGEERAVARFLRLRAGDANALVLDYKNGMAARGLAPRTVNQRIAALKSLAKLGRMLGMITWAIEIKGFKVRKLKDTRGPGSEAVLKVRAALQARRDPKAARDLALLDLIYTHALRRKEAVGVDVADLDLKGSRMRITGKGQDEPDWITLPGMVRAAIERWLAIRGAEPGPLFLSFDHGSRGARLTGHGVWRIVRGHGLGWPHGLRHSGISRVIQKSGGDLKLAQGFSRHKDIRTLMLYDDDRRDLGGEGARMLDEDKTGGAPTTP